MNPTGTAWPEGVVAPGTRLRHLRTEYAAECIPAIEHADVYLAVLTGAHVGEVVVVLAVETNGPVAVRRALAVEQRLVVLPSRATER